MNKIFTGIIQELGVVVKLQVRQDAARLTVGAEKVLAGVQLGDSIAVNGVCLTVVDFSERHFTVDIMPETLRRTNLAELKPGDIVNLEPALTLGARLGGHLVSGHIDDVGRIAARHQEGNAIILRISAPPAVMKYIIPKGSIAVDGISLTVTSLEKSAFTVSVIPHTAAQTNLGQRKVNDPVNLENDLIGKYVARLLAGQEEDEKNGDISLEMLTNYGFL